MALQNLPNIYASRIQGHLQLSASTASSAQLNLITGTAPTSPVAGDIYHASGILHIPMNYVRIGSTTPTSVFTVSSFQVTASNGGSQDALIASYNSNSTSQTGIVFGESNTNRAFLAKYGSAFGGSFGGSSVPTANTTQLLAGSGYDTPIVFSGTPIISMIGGTATNYGTRLDATGLRIGQLSNLHTSNTVAFEVTSGTTRFTSLAGTGSRFLEVDSSGNVSAVASSSITNASSKLFAYLNFY